MPTIDPQAFIDAVNARTGGWVKAMGIVLTGATDASIACEWTVGDEHLQGYGIVHGGVYSGVIETLCSVGAAMHAHSTGRYVVGIENTTSFLRAVRGGRLRGSAHPLTRGRRSQLWQGDVRDDDDRLIATGRVRLLCLEPESELAGESVAVKPHLS